jgi:oxepin-CoA hydrolase/3-oxo-5,6-dehydrosuberyl-CoA semialdehyde dehydrogenase
VAIATILTMVQKKSPFVQINRSNIESYLAKLTENTTAKWGMMKAQHMVEHLEKGLRIASGEIQDFEIATPEEHLAKVNEMVFNHKPMPKDFKHPLMEKESTDVLIHADLATAKQKMIEAYDACELYFKENPEATTKNAVFGIMDKFEWDLLNVKHFNHHFDQFGIL